jgi:hypothetical protein
MNDQSKPFWITVRRNDGKQKFYSSAGTREEAQAIADFRNKVEVDLRKERAAERGSRVDKTDLYTYEVVAR